ncbi:symmetrical bis(5'-nucleosyl)-tetraphosphatase [Marinicellulosiphila megalodicopiae]|uniref:symmetrical bis(5'-nucleosyl)-tetraphosphatase n=1 Tax=Marinicellulosiphila megalodicopiae TaxID=2724896 RepID=UPI003BB00D39
MAKYIVGDLQGSLTPLLALLSEVEFNYGKDELWLAGDIVNRGSQSLACLEFIMRHESCVKIVLGNHDLHLLAIINKVKSPGKFDTLDDILNHKNCKKMAKWLYQQPLVHHNKKKTIFMSHAGLPHIFSAEKAVELSNEFHQALIDKASRKSFFKNMYGNQPAKWDDSLKGNDRLRVITNYFTRMRMIEEDGTLELMHKAGADLEASLSYEAIPWFEQDRIIPFDGTWYFGHWAALEGNSGHHKYIATDAGYIWDGYLKMVNPKTNEMWLCDSNLKIKQMLE